MRRTNATAAGVLILILGLSAPALACGGLVNPNGTVSLLKTTTLAAYVDGVEHYVTSFEFAGGGAEFGSIVPLPGIPTEVKKAGDWTLQRLVEEVRPPLRAVADFEGVALAANAKVILETSIEALDITILKGGGDEVGRWASENGFVLTPDAPEILDHYAAKSPIFMAARFNVERAAELEQQVGQGTPIQLTIPTDHPWVPLRILGLGRSPREPIEADVFLLTEDSPLLVPFPSPPAPDRGLILERSEPASRSLLADLGSDKGMGWMPSDDMWLTYLKIDSTAAELTYDLDAWVTGYEGLGIEPTGDRGPGPFDGWVWPLLPIPVAGLALVRITNRVADRL